MIERFYLKDYLSFKNIELNLSRGLIVFTGASGSGKSVLMDSILSTFGLSDGGAALCESQINWNILGGDFGIENEDINVFRQIKKEKVRFFINNQSISKKDIKGIGSNYIRHLSLKDYSDFENKNLLEILDNRVKNADIQTIKERFKLNYLKYLEVSKELQEIEDEEKRIVELKEFAAFEIQKINDINPKIGEDEALLEIKKELSKKEKSTKKIEEANKIFDYEHVVASTLEFLEIENSFFDDAMNELRAHLDEATQKFTNLEDIDVEEVLNRIEALSSLKRRYGGIKEALEYKELKLQELERYNNIEITKDSLVDLKNNLHGSITEDANKMTQLRESALADFTKDLNSYVTQLYLRGVNVKLKEIPLGNSGQDFVEIILSETPLDKVSTGEFNRLRLAILAIKSESSQESGGVLMLDEIDANLSGEESMSVAKVLRHLSKKFQIFVISHQPQLTSMGDQHFLVHKSDGESFAKLLQPLERIDEIARMISGESITNEAKLFAKDLLEVSKCVL
ncbi:MAG: AAA family ATPase [Thiovulaceae bacterium]|nr:AAA family ATPase [Sulfurimonadaceae bacterium]